MAEYINVPGFSVNIKDGGLGYPIRVAPTTQAVLIVGPSDKGPFETPTLVTDPTGLVQFGEEPNIYGTTEKRNYLTTAWKQAYDAGCRAIYLMRLDDTEVGEDERDKKLFHSLRNALDLLTDFDMVDHVVIVGLYANQEITFTEEDLTKYEGLRAETYNPLEIFSSFIQQQIYNNNEMIGYIGAKPLGKVNPSLADVREHIESLEDLEDNYHGFVSVIGGVDLMFGAGYEYIDNGVAAYAGLASTLPPHSATTNKLLPGARLVYTPTLSMLDQLGDKKYVSFRQKGGAAVVTLDVTAAPDQSDFVLLSTARIILAAIAVTREVCEPFIGESATLQSFNAMETALHRAYKSMVEAESIIDYRFTINMSNQDFLLGRSTVNLEIIPAMERRNIRLDISATARL